MDLFDPTQNLLADAMRGSAARQSALAANLANANTPGYRRVDVDFQDALRAAWDAGQSTQDVAFSAQSDQGAVMRADGSTVDVDVETSQLAANGLEYEALVAAARGRLSILQSAIGVG